MKNAQIGDQDERLERLRWRYRSNGLFSIESSSS